LERVRIVHSCLVEKKSLKEVAEQERTKYLTVQQLVKKTTVNPSFLSELREKEERKEQARDYIETLVKKALQNKSPIIKVEAVSELLGKKFDGVLNKENVRLHMKKVLGLRYRKIRRQPIQTNSERCLVQRQQYALRMLDTLSSGKRVLNVDESWLSETEYSRRMWYPTSSEATLPDKPLSKRHSLIVALDTEGRMYFALYHVNTDSDMMELFFAYLAQQLDNEDA
jgi:hypothetical protein